jgi:hypothetical protein
MAIAPRRGSPRRDVHSVKVVEEFDLSSPVYLLGRTMNTETCCKRPRKPGEGEESCHSKVKSRISKPCLLIL